MDKEISYLICSGTKEELDSFGREFVKNYSESKLKHIKEKSLLVISYLKEYESKNFLIDLQNLVRAYETITYIHKDSSQDVDLDIALDLSIKHTVAINGFPEELIKMLRKFEKLNFYNHSPVILAFDIPLNPNNREDFKEIRENLLQEDINYSNNAFTECFMI